MYPPRFFWLLTVLFIFSCSKTELISRTSPENLSLTENKFFNTHRTANASEKSIIDYLKRVNGEQHFVEKTVGRIGYPRWDKMIMHYSKAKNQGARNEDSAYTYFIPFVRDSANVVNASMIVTTTATDTSFRYLCDWQYRDTVSTGLSSRSQFLLLMDLDKNVFGERMYKILDTTAFGKNENNKTIAYVKLANSNNNAGNNLMVASTVSICYEYWHQKDYGQLVGCPPGPTCMDWEWRYRCDNYTVWNYVEEGGGSTGGGTSTGGGGSPGGGSTPPDCDIIPVDPINAGRNVDPCEPGWEPTPIDDEPPIGYFDPIIINGVTYTTTNFPGNDFGFPWKWWENSSILASNGGIPFGSWAINYLSLNPTVNFQTFKNWFFTQPEFVGGEGVYDPNSIYYDQAIMQSPLPSLSSIESFFPKLGSSGNYSQMPSPDVYQLVGGSLYQSHLSQPAQYSNACAIRGSRALLYSGIEIPILRYGTSGQRTQKGGDNKNYILDAVSFDKFMKDKFGDTPHKLEGSEANNPQSVADFLNGKTGIYVIINNNPTVTTGAGYSGHVDLILNGQCIGGAYVNPTGGVKSIRIWVLN